MADPDPDSEKKADPDPGKKLGSETLLAVPYFTISVYGNSCSSLFFGLILSYFLSLSIIFCIGYAECQSQNKRKRKQRSENEAGKKDNYMNCRIQI